MDVVDQSLKAAEVPEEPDGLSTLHVFLHHPGIRRCYGTLVDVVGYDRAGVPVV